MRLIVFIFILIHTVLNAQIPVSISTFPDINFAKVSGAPKLTSPILITGASSEISSHGYGLAAPAFFDMDGDGLKDLLIGEFASGLEHERYVGNFIRVYKNIGTEEQPMFEGTFDYARPPFQYRVQNNGTPYSVDQFCCIGFTPQFCDLNGDTIQDLITGTYQGEVIWFEGSELGFVSGKPLTQEGNPRDPDFKSFVQNQEYWLFSSATFGDLNGDGLYDLVTGGTSLRISTNVGTPKEPNFSKRELLLDIEGKPLTVYKYSEKELAEDSPLAGDFHISPVIVDWDNDGVLDLLTTNSYDHKGLSVVSFFRGRKTNGVQRFEKEVSLFTSTINSKIFPGSNPKLFVTDWNNDGIKDLLIGISVITLNEIVNNNLSWKWEKEADLPGIGKDPAAMTVLPEKQVKSYLARTKIPDGISADEFLTIRHRGLVYIMLGK